MKVLLAKCPREFHSHFEENSESLALAYLASVLRQDNDVDILDASLLGLSLNETTNRILWGDYDLIGFTIADPTFIESTFKVVDILRKNGVKSHITIGGHTPTFHYKEVLEICPGLDSIVMYEGEGTISELVESLKREREWWKIKGLAYRNNNSIRCNPPRPLISNLDGLPFPVRDTLLFLLEHKKETGVVSMSGGRGCYMNCGFCSIKAFYTIPDGAPWRFRSNKNIVDEMEYVVKKYKVSEILFIDDVFAGPGNKNKKRITEFHDEVAKRNLKIMLSISERADNVNRELFGILRDTGVRQILLGVESATQEILEYFNKKITPKQVLNAVNILEDLNIDVTVSFINFTPISTLKHLRENLYFLVNLKLNILQGLLNRFQVYKGTPLGEKMFSSDKLLGNFPNFSYKTIDERVDIVYDIVQKTLGTFLSTAFELKKIERNLRMVLFQAEINNNFDEIRLLRNMKNLYRKMVTKIMEEASDIFKKIIDFAETKYVNDKNEVKRFTYEIRDISASSYENWLNMVNFFRDFNPILSLTSNGIIEKRKEEQNVRI